LHKAREQNPNWDGGTPSPPATLRGNSNSSKRLPSVTVVRVLFWSRGLTGAAVTSGAMLEVSPPPRRRDARWPSPAHRTQEVLVMARIHAGVADVAATLCNIISALALTIGFWRSHLLRDSRLQPLSPAAARAGTALRPSAASPGGVCPKKLALGSAIEKGARHAGDWVVQERCACSF